MRIATYVFLGAALLALTPSTAGAQDKPVHVNFGGGPTFLRRSRRALRYRLGPRYRRHLRCQPGRFGFQFEYAYRWFDINDDVPVFGATAFSANHQTHQLDFNVVVNLTPPVRAVRSLYRCRARHLLPQSRDHRVRRQRRHLRSVLVYVCGTYPVEAVVGSRGGWDFGFNIGGGVGFGIGESAEFYVETRYH